MILNDKMRKTVEGSDCDLLGHVSNSMKRVLKLVLVRPKHKTIRELLDGFL